ncbi:Protein CBG27086 [Caenorhabditis briggsae]|uniref:Protein CBG27086 n=1 Tax=Caenorhabditis briggsae TaxID=6238 RepID=B6IHG2_CAEBR|nr:Protein CBG27086 [Caenorhabditis briggsae]CAR99342.1 Protein CBG27086 [Caenorhabditis briggsae]
MFGPFCTGIFLFLALWGTVFMLNPKIWKINHGRTERIIGITSTNRTPTTAGSRVESTSESPFFSVFVPAASSNDKLSEKSEIRNPPGLFICFSSYSIYISSLFSCTFYRSINNFYRK